MDSVRVRLARPEDIDVLAPILHALWRDGPVEEHRAELVPILGGKPPGILPLVIFVAETAEGALIGFVEVNLRSYADGCDPSHPVGYLEGWYVAPEHRDQRVGARLLAAAEDWARGQGCVEMASDTWIDNEASQRVHEALGFEVVDTCVNYRKLL
jgi:aminoglycoside 6'-N-acetyltransferase I